MIVKTHNNKDCIHGVQWCTAQVHLVKISVKLHMVTWTQHMMEMKMDYLLTYWIHSIQFTMGIWLSIFFAQHFCLFHLSLVRRKEKQNNKFFSHRTQLFSFSFDIFLSKCASYAVKMSARLWWAWKWRMFLAVNKWSCAYYMALKTIYQMESAGLDTGDDGHACFGKSEHSFDASTHTHHTWNSLKWTFSKTILQDNSFMWLKLIILAKIHTPYRWHVFFFRNAG